MGPLHPGLGFAAAADALPLGVSSPLGSDPIEVISKLEPVVADEDELLSKLMAEGALLAESALRVKYTGLAEEALSKGVSACRKLLAAEGAALEAHAGVLFERVK